MSGVRHTAVAVSLALALAVAGCGEGKQLPSDATAAKPADKPTTKQAPEPAPATDLPTEAEGNAALARFAKKHRPVYCGGKAKKWVALTFDDGPGPYTKNMLKILRHANLPASFFIVGRNVDAFKSSLMAEQKYGFPIGNHSWSHPLLTTLGYSEQRAQLADTNKAITRATGDQVRYFRPPYGAHDAATDKIARNLDMPIILWNIDSKDSLGANSKKISKLVKKGLKPGSIILMHENHGQTIRAMKYTIVPALKKSGLTPVTVPQMLAGNPPTGAQLAKGRKGCR
jgi:peptidoglycan/xylan/chitin deacetylase (PgdA/CDA1 family)